MKFWFCGYVNKSNPFDVSLTQIIMRKSQTGTAIYSML